MKCVRNAYFPRGLLFTGLIFFGLVQFCLGVDAWKDVRKPGQSGTGVFRSEHGAGSVYLLGWFPLRPARTRPRYGIYFVSIPPETSGF